MNFFCVGHYHMDHYCRMDRCCLDLGLDRVLGDQKVALCLERLEAFLA